MQSVNCELLSLVYLFIEIFDKILYLLCLSIVSSCVVMYFILCSMWLCILYSIEFSYG